MHPPELSLEGTYGFFRSIGQIKADQGESTQVYIAIGKGEYIAKQVSDQFM
ncbi:MAG TPA: hypothetical protein VK102_01590 [Sphingobacterium sp.]|nr:hypothetical protein [Sphingobacterium sp.]